MRSPSAARSRTSASPCRPVRSSSTSGRRTTLSPTPSRYPPPAQRQPLERRTRLVTWFSLARCNQSPALTPRVSFLCVAWVGGEGWPSGCTEEGGGQQGAGALAADHRPDPPVRQGARTHRLNSLPPCKEDLLPCHIIVIKNNPVLAWSLILVFGDWCCVCTQQ